MKYYLKINVKVFDDVTQDKCENLEAMKQRAVYSGITLSFMKQYSFKHCISTFCQVANQHLPRSNERYILSVFNYVVFIDFYESSFC